MQGFSREVGPRQVAGGDPITITAARLASAIVAFRSAIRFNSAMPEPHRYTGDLPPIEVIDEFPNWEFALDEEGEPGQDETTIRPEAEQTFITEWTGFTAADAWLASGKKFTAMVRLDYGQVSDVYVFQPPEGWKVDFDDSSDKWLPFVQHWLPEEKRMRSVKLSDRSVFPLRIATRLPMGQEGRPWRAIIQPDGSQTDWT